MNLLTQYLKPYIGRISLGVSIKFFGSLMDLLLPWILAYIIDSDPHEAGICDFCLGWGDGGLLHHRSRHQYHRQSDGLQCCSRYHRQYTP